MELLKNLINQGLIMHFSKAFFALAILTAFVPPQDVNATIFKCNLEGKLVLQDVPCQVGVEQSTVDVVIQNNKQVKNYNEQYDELYKRNEVSSLGSNQKKNIESANSVELKIRQIYAKKYHDNFSMQKTLIADQLDSYKFMQRWGDEPGVPNTIFNEIKSIYLKKYPYNFSMQKTLVKDQCESYLFLRSYLSDKGVPDDVIAKQKQKYEQKYPYNYSMQKTLVLDQVNSYKEIKH